MPTFELTVETDPRAGLMRLRLLDEDGAQLGAQQVRLAKHAAARWEGLFDTRRYVERYANALRDEHGHVKTTNDLLEELGVFLGQHVLGPEITAELSRTHQQRTLLVRLPTTESDVLAAALARVPWELARPAAGQPPLMDRNLVVRATTQSTEAGDSTVDRVARRLAETKGVVRVLAVFAEAPGSQPLAMRLERERLRELFEREILPRRNVELEVLCHGVTRDVLRERIKSSGGFHIVHWSGHGHHDRLEILGDEDERSSLSGKDLVEIVREAGGFVPQLFFLSACLSGTVIGEHDWTGLRTALGDPGQGHTREMGPAPSLREVLDLDNAPGYTGTAMALLHAGVPQVVAMRYSVGDDYARELSWWFYKRLLADEGKPPTEAALALARADVRQRGSTAANRMPVDHVNPLFLGQEGRRIEPEPRRSKQMQRLRPRPQPLLPRGVRALERPELFVGRERALTRLGGISARARQQLGVETAVGVVVGE